MVCLCACGMYVSFFYLLRRILFSFLFLVAVEASSYLISRDYTLNSDFEFIILQLVSFRLLFIFRACTRTPALVLAYNKSTFPHSYWFVQCHCSQRNPVPLMIGHGIV